MEIAILVHLIEGVLHFALSAHALEAGIVATNILLVRVTWKTLPADVRTHKGLVRRIQRHRFRQDRLATLCPKYARYQVG